MANRTRNRAFCVRLSDEEYDLWISKQNASKLGKTDCFIRMLNSTVIKVYNFNETLKLLHNDLRKIGVNLNQIAYYSNSGSFPQAEQEIQHIYQLYNATMSSLKSFLERPLINAKIVESGDK